MPIPNPIKINNACSKHIFKGLYRTIRLTILLGLKTVLNFKLVPNPFINDLKILDMNFASRFDMMDKGMPLRHIISSEY